MNDVFYRLFHGPLSIRGFVLPDANGDYTVFVNDDLSEELKAKTILHEQEHIALGHLESDVDASELEEEVTL